MKKVMVYLLIVITLTGCQSNVNNGIVYYSSIDEAIEQGLIEEGIGQENILSKQNMNNGVIVIFFYNYGISVATLTEQPEGWRWYRSSSYYGFDGESPIMHAGSTTVTENGEKIDILIGKVNDNNITGVQVKHRIFDTAYNIPLYSIQGSSYFCEILYTEYSDIEVVEAG